MFHAVIHKHQMIAEGTVGLRAGLPRQTLAAHKAQGGRHVPSVGGSVSGRGSARCLTSSCNWPSAVATVARPLSHSIASRLPPSGRGDRRANLLHLPRLARRNSSVLHNRIRQDRDVPERHVQRPFKFVGFDTDEHKEGQVFHEQEPVASGARSV